MYRVICLVSLLCVVHCYPDKCYRSQERNVQHKRDHHRTIFEEVARDVIAADKKVQDYCKTNSNGATREIVEEKSYKLVLALENVKEEDVNIKVRHKVMYLTARTGTDKPYAEIRMLPPIVNRRLGKFFVENDEVNVVFPVKTSTDSCSEPIDDEIFNIQLEKRSSKATSNKVL